MYQPVNSFLLLIYSLLLTISTTLAAAPTDPRAHAEFYVDTYGLVDPAQSLLAKRAHQIFERIHQVAEDPVGITPALKIVDSKGKPWAISLPDGYIILSRAALDICYQDVDYDTGDARLAFVLGHELAHLTANDFWHRKIYLSLSGTQNNRSLENIRDLIRSSAGASADSDWRKVVQNKELRADEVGFTYASLAGFQTNLIFSEKHGGEGFLEHWVTQTRSTGGDLHFSPRERSEFLRNRFSAIVSKVEYFMSGVRLAHFGRYEDAAYFFEEFRNAFPAHEVLNNLGYVNLQLARKHMPPALRYRYWLPVLMDNAPPFVVRNRSLGDGMPANSLQYLKRAAKYLQKAAVAHPTHLTSRLNLTVTYLYLQNYHRARATIEEARTIAPDSAQVVELRALVLYGQEKEVDMWPIATDILKKQAAIGNTSTLYNLARLYEERGRTKTAQHYWSQLLSLDNPIPETYLRIACNKYPSAEICEQPYPAERQAPLQLELDTGLEIGSPAVKARLRDWQHQYREIGPLPVNLYIASNGNSWLAIDSRLTIAVASSPPFQTTEELIHCCGTPLAIEPLGDGELWSWGSWSAVINDKSILEIWISDSRTSNKKTAILH